MRGKNRIINSFLSISILFLTSIVFAATLYLNVNFSNQNIDEMLFYLFNGLEGTSIEVFINAIGKSILPFLIVFLLLYLPIMPLKKRHNIIEIKLKNRVLGFSIFPWPLLYKYRLIYSTVMFIFSVVVGYNQLGIKDYLARFTEYSSFIEEYYVNGKDISITFPEEKKNLIILYLESAENTFINKDNGGGWTYTVVPELEELAMENINFSNSNKIGGAYPISGTGWTVAGLIATTAGIPLKIPIDGNSYTSSENFLGGAYTLGDILKGEGYNLKVMFGSDAGFGGRSNYYSKHGNYEIFDVFTAINEGKMLESEQVWWGFDDSHLFKWAKEEIMELATLEEPFSFSFLTANTHFPDGYLENGVEKLFKTQYENAFYFSSKQVAEFVSWFQKQDFYENTSLVIVGDHRSMQEPGYFNSRMVEGYDRTIYNAFINSSVQSHNHLNRIFTALDIYPTILASIGVKIEGDRLGLGTNLFSNRKTLVEDIGLSNVNEEINKNSNFYNEYILQGDYIDLLNQAKP